MKYSPHDDKLKITVPELVCLARIRTRKSELTDGETAPGNIVFRGEEITELYQNEKTCWEITGIADLSEETLTVTVNVNGDPRKPDGELIKQSRGVGFCLLAMLYRSGKVKKPSLRILYSQAGGETVELSESPTPSALLSFFYRLFASVERDAAAELERVKFRLPSMENAKFPYPEVREGQRDLISSVFRTVRGSYTLYACAPTGTGKTISVLFPAIRALGCGYCEKIFYLTPKNTAGLAAVDAIERMAATGADIRAVVLTAKDRICPNHSVCREPGVNRCPLSRSAPSREDAVARALIAQKVPVVDMNLLREIGEKEKLCPYELSLRYAELCDVVICDYNYLFDLRVSLRRFFTDPGDWCFLIDEAHNLVDRARDQYSCNLPLSFFDAFRPAAALNTDLKAGLERVLSELTRILAPLVSDSETTDKEGIRHGFYRQSEVPAGLFEALIAFYNLSSDIAASRKLPLELQSGLQGAVYDLADKIERIGLADRRFTTFTTRFGDALTFRTLCLDPSELIRSRLNLGSSAVLFSATLTPSSYYRKVLGGRPMDDELELPSPFDSRRLCVAVLDKIATRFSEREDTLHAVSRAILTAIKAKPGNYMVFCPSFAYLEELADTVKRLAPGLETVKQTRHMDKAERESFLSKFSEDSRKALLGFTVMGGIYSEGIDLAGRRLIGSIVIGVGLSQPTPDNEAIREYYDDAVEAGREYAYVYPGMNRVLQAAGRVIRRKDDRGVVLLIDDRFSEPIYRELMPLHWRGLKYVGNTQSLTHLLTEFWNKNQKTNEQE